MVFFIRACPEESGDFAFDEAGEGGQRSIPSTEFFEKWFYGFMSSFPASVANVDVKESTLVVEAS